MRDPLQMALISQLTALVGWGPWFIVLMVGGLLCLRRLSKQPREGWLVLAAITISVFARFGITSLIWLVISMGGGRIDFGNQAWMWPLLFELPSSVLQSVAWGVLLFAAFGTGKTASSTYLVEDEVERED